MRTAASETEVTLRLALYGGEIARLPSDSRGVSVREGTAWVTVDGEDKILRPGDTVSFKAGRFPPVVTPLGDAPLILEVLGGKRPRAATMTFPAWTAGTTRQENPL